VYQESAAILLLWITTNASLRGGSVTCSPRWCMRPREHFRKTSDLDWLRKHGEPRSPHPLTSWKARPNVGLWSFGVS